MLFCQTIDTVVPVKSTTLDYLLKQNVLCNKYKSDNLSLSTEKSALELTIQQKNAIIQKKDNNISLMEANADLDKTNIDTLTKQLKTANRKNVVLKVGCISIGALGIASTIYFIIH